MTSITTEPVRSSRLNMRLTPEQRQTIDMAASLKGSSITQWAIDHLVTDARRDIDEETVTRLPSKAFDEFLKALDKQGTAVAYVTYSESGELAGFYSLSAHAMERSSIAGGWLQRNVPERVPMILLGMLGVDRRFQGNGLGRRLLHDAVVRSLGISMELGARALIVDPVDDGAARFYEANGFQHIPESERMFLKLAGKRS